MKLALIGKTGQLGRNLVPFLVLDAKYDIWGPDRKELNLCDTEKIYDAVCKEKPDLIINAAAYTNVDGAEIEKELADRINHQAARELSRAAKTLDVPLIHYSTDYVFDGKQTSAYTEADLPHPLSVYGRTKLKGDECILDIAPKGIIFRVSWIYDWQRHNFFLTMRNLMVPGAKLTVIDDQWGTPNSAYSIARATYETITKTVFGKIELLNLVCEDNTTWYGFACLIRAMLRKDLWVELIPVSTEQYLGKFALDKIVAMRPKYSVLDNTKAKLRGINMPNWRHDLIQFMENHRSFVKRKE